MIDPISVCALIVGCVSAFKDSKELFKQWRQKRKAKKMKALGYHEEALDRNLEDSPPKVKTEYNRLDQALGPPFRRGDDISVSQMQRSWTRFQNKMIRTVSHAITDAIDLSLTKLMCVADTFRDDHLSSMKDLFQRINVSRPIPRPLAAPARRRRVGRRDVYGIDGAEGAATGSLLLPGGRRTSLDSPVSSFLDGMRLVEDNYLRTVENDIFRSLT